MMTGRTEQLQDGLMRDAGTLDYYARDAERYSSRQIDANKRAFLATFKAELAPGARVLDLGSGSGWASHALSEAGFDVHALDASPELAAIASKRLPRPVMVMAFEELEQVDFFDGILALASLHHVPAARLPIILDKLARALRAGGVLMASFKGGSGEIRDGRGRLYAQNTPDSFRAVAEAGGCLSYVRHWVRNSTDKAGDPSALYAVLMRRT